jgi:hypothetical protein
VLLMSCTAWVRSWCSCCCKSDGITAERRYSLAASGLLMSMTAYKGHICSSGWQSVQHWVHTSCRGSFDAHCQTWRSTQFTAADACMAGLCSCMGCCLASNRKSEV